MNVNIVFDNVKAYDVTKFDVKLNEEFKVELTDIDQLVQWFANNDLMLEIKVAEDSQSANIKATSKGSSKIQLQDSNNAILKTLHVEVYDNITTSLNPKKGDTILK